MLRFVKILVAVVICFLSSIAQLHAKEMNDFMKTFSPFCFQNLANMDSARALLDYQGWEPVDEKTMTILGKPANPKAVVEGYKILRNSEDKKGLLIALTEVPNANDKVCTLVPLGNEDYEQNIELLNEYFDVKKMSSYKEGLAFSEVWKIKHPMFSQSIVMTQKYADRPKGEDLGQFHIFGTN